MPSFAALDEDALILMAEDARVRVFARGDHLLRQGRAIDRVFVITGGAVEVSRKGQPMGEVTEGEVGLLGLLAGDPQGVDVVAREHTTALEIPADSVHRNMHESFAITRNTV